MQSSNAPPLTEIIRNAAHPLTGSSGDYDSVLELVGDARFVLLGEASHGTHEFYRERAKITKRLIREKGFNAVALEADWPDAYRVHRYVQGDNADADASEALSGFKRFPSWMWRNADVLDFVGWMRSHNDALEPSRRVGLFGMDLYSMHASIERVLEYLDEVDPAAAHRARGRYSCFDTFGCDPQAYGHFTGLGLEPSCENEAVAQLMELQRHSLRYARIDGLTGVERFFDAEQNAAVVRDAEEYYRAMFQRTISSWNLRDRHMVDTLNALVGYLDRLQPPAKVVVWAHNSHVGDARATQMGHAGEWNIGQLVRQQYGNACRSVGFTTYTGTVTAASGWDSPAERKQVLPARPDSFEGLFHKVGLPAFSLRLGEHSHAGYRLRESMLERAIGVVYLPASELASHYFLASLSDQFDAVLHFDETRAVEPLEPVSSGDEDEPPETFPSGM